MPSRRTSFQAIVNMDADAVLTSTLYTHLRSVVAIFFQIRSESVVLEGDGILDTASVRADNDVQPADKLLTCPI